MAKEVTSQKSGLTAWTALYGYEVNKKYISKYHSLTKWYHCVICSGKAALQNDHFFLAKQNNAVVSPWGFCVKYDTPTWGSAIMPYQQDT